MTAKVTTRATPPLALYSGFACTGAYTTMLGTVLPLLAAQWVMPDSRAGMLFLAQFCGSMLGALLRAPQLPRLIAAGFACIAGSCAAFALLSPALGPWLWPAACVLLFLFGLGLGTAMTSTSVMVASGTRGQSGSALELLNALWALGAGSTPWLVLLCLRVVALRSLLLLAAAPAILLCFRLFAAADARSIAPSVLKSDRAQRQQPKALAILRIGTFFGFLSFASVGVETAVGGWMTSYVSRAAATAHLPVAGLSLSAAGAGSGFWLGLLAGRLLAAGLLVIGVAPSLVWIGSLSLSLVSLSLLLVNHAPAVLIAVACACGFGVGPLYPLVLTYALRLLTGRWVFVLAGLGSACVPWATGLLSSRFHTLYVGLTLPLILVAAMLVAVLVSRDILLAEEPVART